MNKDVGQKNDATLAIQLQRPDGSWVDVGWLERRDQTNWFSFAESYWHTANRPVLGQIYEEAGRRWQSRSMVALPRWFSHLLPEGRLREAVARAAHINSKREFDMISRLGLDDLPGAIRAFGVTDRENVPVPEPSEEPAGPSVDPVLKFSLAGAQLKFSVFGDEKGLTVPVAGQAGNFIVKFPDGRPGFIGVPEAELGGLKLAEAIGIPTPEAFIIDPREISGLENWSQATEARQALAVRRFDRLDKDHRVHMEELAQVLDVVTLDHDAKYQKTFEAVAVFIGGIAGIDSVGQVIDRIVLNVLLGNGDAHLKNWAFIYPDGRNAELSPVYDILPTVLYIENDDLGLKFGGSKSFGQVTYAHFELLGQRAGLGKSVATDRARSAVARVNEHWPILREYLSTDNFSTLSERLKTLPIAK